MARFYANENFPLQVVGGLRGMGHDVLTSFEAGNANRAVPDREVLRFAAEDDRWLLTQNRLHFLRLHQAGVEHAGIVLCTFDPDFRGQAERIHQAVGLESGFGRAVVRVNRPA